jgi:hypothetical protein
MSHVGQENRMAVRDPLQASPISEMFPRAKCSRSSTTNEASNHRSGLERHQSGSKDVAALARIVAMGRLLPDRDAGLRSFRQIQHVDASAGEHRDVRILHSPEVGA